MSDANHPSHASQPSELSPGHASKPTARVVGTIPVVVAFVGLVAGVMATRETYVSVQAGRGAAAFDQPVQAWMLAHRIPWLDTAATWFTNLGGKVGMTILATLTVLALARWWRTWTPIVVMVGATAGSLTMTTLGKDLTARARPPPNRPSRRWRPLRRSRADTPSTPCSSRASSPTSSCCMSAAAAGGCSPAWGSPGSPG